MPPTSPTQVLAHFNEGRMAEALAGATDLLAHLPDLRDVRLVAASAAMRQGELALAFGHLRQALRRSPGDEDARRLMSDVLRTPVGRLLRFLLVAGIRQVIDVGANVGQFAAGLRQAGYAGPIVSFEPAAEALPGLRARSLGDPLWAIRECALGDRNGTAALHVAGNAGDSSSLLGVLPATAALVPQMAQATMCEVRVERLDSHAAALSLRERPTLLKIDVQGAEDAVLCGAGDALGDMVAIHAELSVVPLYEGQRLMHEIVGDLGASGFRLVDLEPYMIDPKDACLMQVNATFVRHGVALSPILRALVDEPAAEPRQ